MCEFFGKIHNHYVLGKFANKNDTTFQQKLHFAHFEQYFLNNINAKVIKSTNKRFINSSKQMYFIDCL